MSYHANLKVSLIKSGTRLKVKGNTKNKIK